MTKFQGGIISSTQNVAIGNQYTGRANGIWALPHQMQSKQAALWAQSKAPPSAPTITNVTAANTIVTVEFSPPASLNGETVTGYTVTSSGGQSVTGASSPIIVTGLTNGTSYTFTAVANSTSGPSVASNTSSSVVPAEFLVPGAPTIGTALVQYNVANVPFTAPASDGGKPITSYTATSSPGGITGILNQSGSGTIVVTGLTAGVSYTFTVTATNMIGNSSPSSASNSVTASTGPIGLWSWGSNSLGQLGLGNTTGYSSPKQIGSLITWSSKIGGAYSTTLSVKTDGTLWAWGYNSFGQLGLGNTSYYSSPKQVGALTNWASVTTGHRHAVATKTDGTLWSWGSNAYGSLGLGGSSYYSSPKQIGAATNWLLISAAQYQTGAIKTDGTLWMWGYNGEGQLGLGNLVDRSTPTQVGLLTNWSKISLGYRETFAIKTDGTLWSWGYNSNGQLGLGNTTAYSSPKQIGSLTNWLHISAGTYYCVFAIKTDGTLWAWGSGGRGKLGLGNTTSYSSPKQVGSLTNWLSVSCGRYHGIATKTDGTLWAWGSNEYGQLGLGTIGTNYSSPKQVGTLTTWIKTLASFGSTTATQSAISLPGAPTGISATRIPNATSATVSFTAPANNGGLTISKYTATSSPGGFTGVLNQAGSGSITVSGLDANTAYTFTVTATNFMGTGPASSSVATVAPATLWSWGQNNFGNLGLSDTTNRSSPVQVGALANWLNIASGNGHCLAIKSDGTLWAWGRNNYGQLGQGTTTGGSSSPVQVGALSNWSSIACEQGVSIAIKTDGTLWSWGYGSVHGSLMQGATDQSLTPLQVGTLTNWKTVSVGYNYVMLTKTDGTLWAAGRNYYGELGLGNSGAYANRSSPVQVGALSNWKTVSAGDESTIAVKTDGTIWSWGGNYAGQLGLGNGGWGTERSSPVQIGLLTNWSTVSLRYRTAVAIKTDGTLWVWGLNTYGQLGLNNTTYYSSPKQVGALTNWLSVSCGMYHTASSKTDGTLWTWGRNNSGQLGLGNTTNYSSPKQVGSLTTWLNVAASGYLSTLATRTVSPPDAPTITSAIRSTGSTTATINFTAPAYNGGYAITSYTATSSPGGITGSVSQAGSGSITVSGLDANTTYTFTVTATNSLGVGAASSSVNTTLPPQMLFIWGKNNFGQLGLSNTTAYSSPKQVGTLGNWSNVGSGYLFSVATKTDGTLWTWGKNDYRQLGLVDNVNRSSPTQVGALTNWSSVTAGTYSVLAIKTDGTLWGWGDNTSGILGTSSATSLFGSPVQIGSLSNWAQVSMQSHTLAVKTNGTLWAWGLNSSNQLGLGNATTYESPVQVGSLTNWRSVFAGEAHSLAIKTDGTIWSWGYNSNGQLGLGDSGGATRRSSPTQVGALTNWLTATGLYGYTVASKSDGTLWGWGSNGSGQLGLGNTTYYSSPKQIGTSNDWKWVSSNRYSTMAIKNNGSLLVWGSNYHGNLGLGDTANRNSPTQVGSLTTWLNVAAGYHTLATRT